MMEAILREGLSALSLPTEGIPALTRYAGLLAEKNQVMNLTAITDPAGVARLHFLDSAALLALADLRGKRVVDVGTGAGFPGLPLKILEPSIRLTLLDAQRKRVDFLREVCEELGLEDVECVHSRAEDFAGTHREGFDLAVSRAVAALPVLALAVAMFFRYPLWDTGWPQDGTAAYFAPGLAAAAAGDKLADGVVKGAKAAVEGAEATKTFVAVLGRAGTVGEKSIGYPDAGAYGLGVIFTGLAEFIVSKIK